MLTLTLVKFIARLRLSLIYEKRKPENKNQIIEVSQTQNISTHELDLYTTHIHNLTEFTYHTDAHSPVYVVFNSRKFIQVIKKKERKTIIGDRQLLVRKKWIRIQR